MPSQSNKAGRRNKRKKVGKVEVKQSLFVEDMNLHLEDPKNSAKKLLNIINGFSKITGYKIDSLFINQQ
jgi:hypothetical protein